MSNEAYKLTAVHATYGADMYTIDGPTVVMGIYNGSEAKVRVDALNAAFNAGAKSLWIPCSDRLPSMLEDLDQSKTVLVAIEKNVFSAIWTSTGWVWASYYRSIPADMQPTDWMPLPTAP